MAAVTHGMLAVTIRFPALQTSINMDNTRLFLFAALVFIGMLLWQQWQADYAPQPQPVSQSQSGETPNAAQTGDDLDDLPDLADSVDGIPTQSGTAASENATSASPIQQLVRVDTDVIQV